MVLFCECRSEGSVSVDDLSFIDCTPNLLPPNRQCNPLAEFQCEGDPMPSNLLDGRYPAPKHCIKGSLLCDFQNDCGDLRQSDELPSICHSYPSRYATRAVLYQRTNVVAQLL